MKKALAIIVGLIGLALYMFGRYYGGEYPLLKILPYLVGTALLFVAFKLYTSPSKEEKAADEETQATIKRLKLHGTKKVIDLRECEVVSNNYQEEIQRGALPDVQAWNALNSETAVENIEVNQSRLVYREDNHTFISPLIAKDKTTLEFMLHERKKANIYIDKNTPSMYYFDVDFLNKQS